MSLCYIHNVRACVCARALRGNKANYAPFQAKRIFYVLAGRENAVQHHHLQAVPNIFGLMTLVSKKTM